MKTILLALAILATAAATAQKASVTWGDDAKSKKGVVDIDIIHADKSGIYAQETRVKLKSYFVIGSSYGQSMKLKKFDRDFEPIFDKEYKKELKGRDFNSFFVLKNKVYIYAEDYDKKEKRFQVFVAEIDGGTGDLAGDWTEVLSIEKESKKDEFSFTVINSADSTRMIVVADVSTKEKSSVTLASVDGRLQVSKPITIEFTGEPGTYDMQEVLITPDNKTVVAGKQYEYIETGRKKKKKTRVFKKYLVSIYNADGKKLADVNADADNNYTLNGKIIYSKKGNLLLTGLFTKDIGKKELNGFYLYRINPADGTVLQKSVKEINPAMLGKALDDADDDNDEDTKADKKAREKANEDEEIDNFGNNFEFREIIEGSDGSIVILAETYKLDVYTRTYHDYSTGSNGMRTSRTSTSTYYNHSCGEVLVSRILPDGNINWVNMIPKFQVETIVDRQSSPQGGILSLHQSPIIALANGGGMPFMSSFKTIPYGSKLFLFFNDNPKNEGVRNATDPIKKVTNFKKSDCFMVTVDMANGSFTRKAIFSNEDEPIPYIRHGQVVNNELYVTATRMKMIGKSTFKVGKVVIK